jgi:mono/diheme cytochrome c family protein
MTRWWTIVATAAVAHGCNDCDLNRMIDQPRFTAYEACEVCPHGTIMMQPPAGTVARERALVTGELATGYGAGSAFSTEVPIALDRAVLARGRDRFDIYCAACHGRLGNGRSQVAENMVLRKPPDLTSPPYVDYPAGRIFRVITVGFGLMRSYAAELPLADRWAVVAYVQALQLARHTTLADVPSPIRKEAARWPR